ncbi:stage V sporulation protein AA [Marinicrinis sediminis]|uniref:Stage V sporulation protein AA n=1 Tax=Marinicrinis sediminis TaxID=1652465 RepID=A0ABW5RFP3_9BACL
MSKQASAVIHLKLKKKVKLPATVTHIPLAAIAIFLTTDQEQSDRLEKLIVHEVKPEDGNLILIDILQLIHCMKQNGIEGTIENYGEPHVLIESGNSQKRASWVMIGFIWLLLFFGSGLAIMNFHADVSMQEVHQKMYAIVTGQEDAHPLVMQIPYSIGLGAGMILFFNRIFKKKFNEEPNPLEVEMFMYEENVRQYVIHDEYAKMQSSPTTGKDKTESEEKER